MSVNNIATVEIRVIGNVMAEAETAGEYGRELWQVLHKSKLGYGSGLCLEFLVSVPVSAQV